MAGVVAQEIASSRKTAIAVTAPPLNGDLDAGMVVFTGACISFVRFGFGSGNYQIYFEARTFYVEVRQLESLRTRSPLTRCRAAPEPLLLRDGSCEGRRRFRCREVRCCRTRSCFPRLHVHAGRISRDHGVGNKCLPLVAYTP